MNSLAATPNSRLRAAAIVLGLPVATGFTLTAIRGPELSLAFTTSRLAQTIGWELALALPIFAYLGANGHRLGEWTLPFSRKDVSRSIPVWFVGLLAFAAGGLLAWILSPVLGQQVGNRGFTGHPSIWIILPVSALNAVFEELLWLGFAVNVVGQKRLWPSLAWSLIPRCAIHVYQGWNAIFLVGPLGLWYFRYYWRTGRLWPVVLAHILQDVLALAFLSLYRAG